VPDHSTIYFPLRSNAKALFAGTGVASVRRRILAAAILNDRVVLEDGLYEAWIAPTGGSRITGHGARLGRWQTLSERSFSTGKAGWRAALEVLGAETPPWREDCFSWRATFEPFRRELPASAARWLSIDHFVDDDSDEPIKDMARAWTVSDHLRRSSPNGPSRGSPVREYIDDEIRADGYYDLAVAATAAIAVSIDRRHSLAMDTRLGAGDARPLGGHHALELLLPRDFTWSDVPELRKHRALRDYRAIVREIEAEALRTSRSASEIDNRIHLEYDRRLAVAASKGVPFAGRVALTAVGFVLGAAADFAAPLVGGAAVTAGGFVVGEGLTRLMRPRWLAVNRLLGGRRNGL
jgi:hypothetical protein